jgi:hypothetical protein
MPNRSVEILPETRTFDRQIAAYEALRRTPADVAGIMRGVAAFPGTSSSASVLCLNARTVRVASGFARAGMLRTDVCSLPRGHRGQHRA